MWKLRIHQKKKNTYLKDGKDVSFNSEQEVSLESEDLGSILIMVSNFEQFEPANTEYVITRAEEGAKER